MARAEELYERWKSRHPKEVDPEDFRKVLHHYLGKWVRSGQSGSHLYILEHPALAVVSAFDGRVTFSVAIKSGRKVKGVYVNHLLKAIECIQTYEEVFDEKE